MLAMLFPGMQWIPIGILTTSAGWTIGAVGILAASLDRRSLIARWAIAMTCILGVAAPMLMFVTVGARDFDGVAYLLIATPLLPGVVGILLMSGRRSQATSETAAQLQTTTHHESGLRLLVAGVFFIPVGFMIYYCGIRHAGIAERSEKVAIGMTVAEVKEIMGLPHNQSTYQHETLEWVYQYECSGLGYFSVKFDKAGRVERRWLE